MNLTSVLRMVVVAIVGAATTVPGRAQVQPSLMVFAASDLGPAFAQIVSQFEQHTHSDVTLVLGSTGMLAQQIRNGAPADVFFSANETFVQDLTAEHLTIAQTSAIYAVGRVAMVTLKSRGLRIERPDDLTDTRVRRISMANPQHAPYGMAAKQALLAAGLWGTLESRLVFGENVQQAVQFVRSGSADAGLVARSIADTPDLHWKLVDQTLHAPLRQMAVVLARTKMPVRSRSFIEFVNGTQGRAVMRRFGFGS